MQSNHSLTGCRCPYVAGTTLLLNIGKQSRNAKATIISVFEPFTMSCSMVIQLDCPPLSLKGCFVLKLYDRRFATGLRQNIGACPWNPDIEDEYRRFVYKDRPSNFFKLCSDEFWVAEEQENWNRAQYEAFLQYSCRKFRNVEVKVYDRIQDIQGKDVPRLFARLSARPSSNSSSISEYLGCKGILLEFIQGFPLTNLSDHAPNDTWQYICEDAIQIVNRIGGRDICNKDVKTRNFIVRKDPDTGRLKVFMIDFGLCRLRKRRLDDQDWKWMKAVMDEEGAVGKVMERKLKGGFEYRRTPQSEKLQDEFMSGKLCEESCEEPGEFSEESSEESNEDEDPDLHYTYENDIILVRLLHDLAFQNMSVGLTKL